MPKLKKKTVIQNIKQESGASLDLLKVRAEGKGVSVEELVCREGLPLEPTFNFLISILKYTNISPSFKEYVAGVALKLGKTNEDFIALKSCGIILSAPNNSIKTSQEIVVVSTSNQFIIPEIIEEINNLQTCPTPDISKEDRQRVVAKLDILVCGLLKEAGDNGDKLLEIYRLLQKGNRRIPYLKQKLTRLGYQEYLETKS